MSVMEAKKVLVVDDDNDILDVIQIILEDEGYEVSTLNNAREIIKEMSSNRPDLILLDVMLCGMDGRDVCKNMKTNPAFKMIPIIMISASHNLKGFLEQKDSADGFISKPFDIDNLIGVVNSHFSNRLAV
jgi:DNA-binding response OmpR family regulator